MQRCGHVAKDEGAPVADVGEVIDRRSAAIHADFFPARRRSRLRFTLPRRVALARQAGIERDKFLHRAGQCIEQFQAHLRLRKLSCVARKESGKSGWGAKLRYRGEAHSGTAPSPSPRPSGERDGVRGFESGNCASSPRPSPPLGEEREKTGAVPRNASVAVSECEKLWARFAGKPRLPCVNSRRMQA